MAVGSYRDPGSSQTINYTIDSDPSVVGLAAEPGALVVRTDNNSIYYHSGPLDTDWTLINGGGGGSSPSIFSVINTDVAPILAGMVVTPIGKRANNVSLTTSLAAGIAIVGNAPTLPVTVQSEGEVILPTAAWDVVTGQVGGLSVGVKYFIDSVSGMLTFVPPSISGQSVTYIGCALSPTSLLIETSNPILL